MRGAQVGKTLHRFQTLAQTAPAQEIVNALEPSLGGFIVASLERSARLTDQSGDVAARTRLEILVCLS